MPPFVNMAAVFNSVCQNAICRLFNQAFFPNGNSGGLDGIRFCFAQRSFRPHGAVIGTVDLITDIEKQQ